MYATAQYQPIPHENNQADKIQLYPDTIMACLYGKHLPLSCEVSYFVGNASTPCQESRNGLT